MKIVTPMRGHAYHTDDLITPPLYVSKFLHAALHSAGETLSVPHEGFALPRFARSRRREDVHRANGPPSASRVACTVASNAIPYMKHGRPTKKYVAPE